MLQDEARQIAEAIDERVNAGASGKTVTVTVVSDQTHPSGVAFGAGRPAFVRYTIEISDGRRVASLDLGQAEMLLESIAPGRNADQVFDTIRSQDVSIEDARS